MSILSVRGVQKIYTTRFGGNRVEALKNVNFDIEEGEYAAVMGESGSGKTTLLNILAALDRPTSGTVTLDGKDLSHLAESQAAMLRRNSLGFVFQEFNLLDTFTVEDNIYLPLVLAGKSYSEMSARLAPIAKKLGITELLRKYPYEISGGQKQRAAVARAIITEPKLLLADEPTGALDSAATDELLRLFSELNRSGQTILMVTHSVKAASHAGSVLFIKDGEIFHRIYRGDDTNEQMYQKISDTHPACDGRGQIMHSLFYPKLAVSGIRKNKRLYLPYMLTCTGMIMMFYIVHYLAGMRALINMPGGRTSAQMLGFGVYIIALFSLIFLFYTNSFLMRRRQHEFGLYNVLGMSKRNIAILLFWESLIIFAVSVLSGLFLGMLFSKGAELCLLYIINGDVSYELSINLDAIYDTFIIYIPIFALILLKGLLGLGRLSTVSLLKSESLGEKPPRANYLLGTAGMVLLAAAYYLAVSIESPLSAVVWFFVAVGMVIVATYMIFVSGSVMLCRLLQKSKKYYYNKKHFVFVSSMVYRMKRNGAGLASICVLSTMVTVMMMGVGSLYFGKEESLMTRYPYEISASVDFLSGGDESCYSEEKAVDFIDAVDGVLDENGIVALNSQKQIYATATGLFAFDTLVLDHDRVNTASVEAMDSISEIYLIPLEYYNAAANTSETLASDEILLYCFRQSYDSDSIKLYDGSEWRIKKRIDGFGSFGEAMSSIIPSMFIVVPDLDDAVTSFNRELSLIDVDEDSASEYLCRIKAKYCFDTELDKEAQAELGQLIRSRLRELQYSESGMFYSSDTECREEERGDFYGSFGGIFFLGLLLSVVFLAATVLIIYYKQISEGYEDESRFEIMRKVGMTSSDVRKNIDSQMLTVFFLPPITAALHTIFAFPMVARLLAMFNLRNIGLSVAVTAVAFLIFGIFYAAVCRITSNAYYSIVSGKENERAK